ncbi:MAG TPA: DUF4139 domain-containing protein [Pyrinomonadaceae bacterium]|jgi:hypothetical protein|nr:DUF4139 domain-containing protein [Pyrinomonadaceae bacterium]
MSRLIHLSFVLLLYCMLVAIATAQTTTLTTTARDRRSVNITIYNSNVGLVRETRMLQLPDGRASLRFADVAAQIRPETVHLASLTSADSLSILEQNYQYDLLNPSKLLDKYVGREVTLVLRRYENSTEVLTPVQAVLLSNNSGQVWRIGGQIVINPSNIAEMRFPDLPQNLVATPTLVWDVENRAVAQQTVEASYLTAGMNWRADYVLVVNAADTLGDVQGWVTLTNTSGVGFDDARLQLVAGNLNRVAEDTAMDGLRQRREVEMAASKSVPQFQEQAFFEYHLYTLQRPASIREQETKQVSLLESAGFSVAKEFVINGLPDYYRSYLNPGQPIPQTVGVFVQFRNSVANRLGMPLPAGTIRLYKKDDHGGQQFIGEDRIDHTPKDEDVRVKVGDAFDIVAERKQTDYKVISSSVYEYAYEITIRNHKDAPISVIVNEPIGGDWRMISSNFKAEKTEAFAARFRVQVAKDGEARLVYRVRVKY